MINASKPFPHWLETYCFECHEQRPIAAILGRRRHNGMAARDVWAVAVALTCGHERQGRDERVAMSGENLRKLEDLLVEAKLQYLAQPGVAGALAMTGS